MVGQEGRAGLGATGTVGAHILLIGYVKGESVALKFHSRARDNHIQALNWAIVCDMAVAAVVAAGYPLELLFAQFNFGGFVDKNIAHWNAPFDRT